MEAVVPYSWQLAGSLSHEVLFDFQYWFPTKACTEMKCLLRTKGLLFRKWWKDTTGDFDLILSGVGGGFLLPIVGLLLGCVLESTIGTPSSIVLFFGFLLLGGSWFGFCLYTDLSVSFNYSLCPTCNIAVQKGSKCSRCHGVVK